MSYYVKKMRKQLYDIMNEVLVNPNTYEEINKCWYLSEKELKRMEDAITQEGMNIKRLDAELELLGLKLNRATMKLEKV